VKKKMNLGNVIEPIVEILIGLALFPILSAFLYIAISDPNVTQLTGMTMILPLIGYAVGFGLVIKGYKGLKGGK